MGILMQNPLYGRCKCGCALFNRVSLVSPVREVPVVLLALL